MSEELKPIRTGLCAFGMSGKVFHAPFLSCMPQFEFACVVERHTKKAAETYPGVVSYDNLESLLADDSLELIIVNTPSGTHFEYAKKALEAGKNVVVEKPFTATAAQAQELVDLATAKGAFLVVFQNRRWDSDFMTVKEVIEKGLLGKLVEMEIHYDRYKPELNEIKKHKEKPGPAVGNIYDLGSHLIDEAIVLFGKPEAVFALLQSHRESSLVNDYFDIQLMYDNFNCTLKSSLLVREQLPGYIVHGERGSFIKTRSDVQEAALQEGKKPCVPNWGMESDDDRGLLHTTIDGRDVREQYPSLRGDYKQFFEKVYNSLRKGEASPVPLRDSVLNIQIIDAAFTSSAGRKVITL